jgi:mycoredoxin
VFGHTPVSVSAADGARAADEMWVDIWADTDAAAYVRSVNDGNDGSETVPTVVIARKAHTNPPPRQVVEALALS